MFYTHCTVLYFWHHTQAKRITSRIPSTVQIPYKFPPRLTPKSLSTPPPPAHPLLDPLSSPYEDTARLSSRPFSLPSRLFFNSHHPIIYDLHSHRPLLLPSLNFDCHQTLLPTSRRFRPILNPSVIFSPPVPTSHQHNAPLTAFNHLSLRPSNYLTTTNSDKRQALKLEKDKKEGEEEGYILVFLPGQGDRDITGNHCTCTFLPW